MFAQRTIAQSIDLTGVGLHSGKTVDIRILPHQPDSGIIFHQQRDSHSIEIPARADLIQDAFMCSNLVRNGHKVRTVEHMMSAIAALGIDNLLIEIAGDELPIMDGSAKPFFEALQQGGIVSQAVAKKFIKITHPIEIKFEDKWARFEPFDGFALDFKIDFAHPVLQASGQTFYFEFSTQAYATHIACARTFGFMQDLAALQRQQLALGASLDNAIGLDDHQVLNPEGLRFENEFIRHKILDAIGDLYLLQHQIIGRFSAYKSGHGLNNQLLRAIMQQPDCYELVSYMSPHQCPIKYDNELVL